MIQNWFIYWIFEGVHYIMQIKDFLDGDIESSIVFNLEEISLHKEVPNYIIACQSFGSVCWTLEAIILQHTYIERMYSSITEGSGRRHLGWEWQFEWPLLLFTSGSNSQALEAISLSQYTSQSNRLSTIQQKESPLEAAIYVAVDTASWRSFECRKDYFFGKLFRRGPVKTFSKGKYLHDVIQRQSSFLFLPKGLDSGCQMAGSVLHIYK